MNRASLIFSIIAAAFCLLTAGCSRSNSDTSSIADTNGTWRASIDNGCKPGIGLEIVRDGDKFTGRAFILDPNQPGYLAAGISHTMQISNASDMEIHFAVNWLPDHRDEMVLRFRTPLTTDRLLGVLEDADKSGTPREFMFERIPSLRPR